MHACSAACRAPGVDAACHSLKQLTSQNKGSAYSFFLRRKAFSIIFDYCAFDLMLFYLKCIRVPGSIKPFSMFYMFYYV